MEAVEKLDLFTNESLRALEANERLFRPNPHQANWRIYRGGEKHACIEKQPAPSYHPAIFVYIYLSYTIHS